MARLVPPRVTARVPVHPAVIDAYMDGSLLDTLAQRARGEMKALAALEPEEAISPTEIGWTQLRLVEPRSKLSLKTH